MSYRSLKLRIKKNEGFSYKPYIDQLENETIGYGHLIKKNEKIFFKKKFNKKELNQLFENDFKKSLSGYYNNFKNPSFTKKERELLIEMIFQMGTAKVRKFKKMLKNINKKNKYLTVLEMKDSLWYKQTPKRVENLIKNYLKK